MWGLLLIALNRTFTAECALFAHWPLIITVILRIFGRHVLEKCSGYKALCSLTVCSLYAFVLYIIFWKKWVAKDLSNIKMMGKKWIEALAILRNKFIECSCKLLHRKKVRIFFAMHHSHEFDCRTHYLPQIFCLSWNLQGHIFVSFVLLRANSHLIIDFVLKCSHSKLCFVFCLNTQ